MSNFLLPRFPPSIDPGVERYPGIATGWQDDPGISISSDFTGDPGISRAPGIGPDGLLSGLPEVPEPGPTDGYGLQLLMSPEQISTIDWQSPQPDGGQGDEIARLTIGQAAIRVSDAHNGHAATLLATLAHEMIHLRQHLTGDRELHGPRFRRTAARVCAAHGFDPKIF